MRDRNGSAGIPAAGHPGNRVAFRNNFDLLRFVLAAMVFLFHLPVLSGLATYQPLLKFADGNVAVLGFFAISGYVVNLSFERSRTWKDYAERRARRLLPGYIAVVIICCVAGTALSSAGSYWTNSATWRYLLANLAFLQFLQPDLPGVFANNPVLHAVNGSLWSIRTELLCYVLLPFLGMRVIPLVLISAAAFLFPPGSVVLIAIIHPLACFFLGMYFAKSNRVALPWLGGCGLALLVAAHLSPWSFFGSQIWHGPLMPLAVGVTILAAGLCLPYLGNWEWLGNLSYGIYLWHFPMIQLAISKNWLGTPLSTLLLTACVLTIAALSWHLIEQPSMRRKIRPKSN